MGFLIVILAAVVAYAFGAFWYMWNAKPWMKAAGVVLASDGRPAGRRNPLPYIVGFAAELLVAGMMRHVFVQSGLDTVLEGIIRALASGRSDHALGYDELCLRRAALQAGAAGRGECGCGLHDHGDHFRTVRRLNGNGGPAPLRTPHSPHVLP